MKTCVRILLLALGLGLSLSGWGDTSDPKALVAKLPTPPKDYAAAKRTCADPKNPGGYLSRDAQSQSLADDMEKQVKDHDEQMNKQVQANMAQNMAAAQAAARDPRQMMAIAQWQQAAMSQQLPPDPGALANQLFQASYTETESAIQANAQEQSKSSQDWQDKYSDCGKLPVGTGACEKAVAGKADAEAADIGKKRGPVMAKYYTDLNADWPKFKDGVQKYLDAVTLTAPAGVDPNGYQIKIMLATNQDQRMKAVQTAAEEAGKAICPGFLKEAETQYGRICQGEGC
ncbi:MAG TPA: hypothetical protein VGM16_01720 [Gammaproteobacteria bacterium]